MPYPTQVWEDDLTGQDGHRAATHLPWGTQVSQYFEEHDYMKQTRKLMQDLRNERQVNKRDLARDISEMFGPGYEVSEQKLFAIEAGITKSVPHWIIIGYMMKLNAPSADALFPYVGRDF